MTMAFKKGNCVTIAFLNPLGKVRVQNGRLVSIKPAPFGLKTVKIRQGVSFNPLTGNIVQKVNTYVNVVEIEKIKS